MVFLTDTRRDVLAGEYGGSAKAERQQRYRVKTGAVEALKELIEVAESDEIDNADVFEPDVLAELLAALFDDPDEYPARWEAENETEYLDTYDWETSVLNILDSTHRWYGHRLTHRGDPGRPPGGVVPPGAEDAFYD
jgi:inactivated superfamily I helicase